MNDSEILDAIAEMLVNEEDWGSDQLMEIVNLIATTGRRVTKPAPAFDMFAGPITDLAGKPIPERDLPVNLSRIDSDNDDYFAEAITDDEFPDDAEAERRTFTEDEVREAVNEAASDIQKYGLGAEQHSTVDLVVNVALEYLLGDAETVPDAIESAYQETPAEVLGWCGLEV